MNKIKSIFKVLTFINLELFLLTGLLISSIVYGQKYLKNTVRSIDTISLSLKLNELEKIETAERIERFDRLDNILLDQSLKNIDISENLDVLLSYKDSFKLSETDLSRFDSLLINKAIIFRVIKTFKRSTQIQIDKNDFVSTKKTVEYVPVKTIYTKKKLFGKIKTDTIITYDTLIGEHKIFDSKSFQAEKSLSARVDYNSFQKYIFDNNSLTMHIKSILNKTLISQSDQVAKSQTKLILRLNKNLLEYFKIIVAIVLIFFVILLLLINDLRKKSKKEFRDKYLISMILNRKK